MSAYNLVVVTHQWIMRPDPKKPWRKVKELAPTTVFHNSKPAGQRKGTTYRKPKVVSHE